MPRPTVVAFFGKFQPPHLGHILTISQLIAKYQHVKVVITSDNDQFLPYHEIKKTMEQVYFFSKKVSVHIVDGSIEKKTADLSGLTFDIAVSGNRKVLASLGQLGFETSFVERSNGPGYSGTIIKDLVRGKASQTKAEPEKHLSALELVPLSSLRPLEKVLPRHFANLEEMILRDKRINKPLLIDDKLNIVLDGSHRYAFLVKYGFQLAPVIKVNYDFEPVFVGNRLSHRFLVDDQLKLNKNEIRSRALNEDLLPPRTTRHFFPFRKNDHPVPLHSLVQGSQIDIDYLLESTSIFDEIKLDEQYVEEIVEELVHLENYMNEQKNVQKYLQLQLEKIRSRG
jgi:cytidyltransferase-like protein